jgi:DNA-binding response OmpR family regulator
MPATEPPIVLVVEDDPAIRGLLATVLQDKGYAVLQAHEGRQAIQILHEYILPSACRGLVLLDVMLPCVDGTGVLGYLVGQQARLPVIAMSASSECLQVARGAGVEATIPKPFELDCLLALVDSYCGTASSGAKPPARSGRVGGPRYLRR